MAIVTGTEAREVTGGECSQEGWGESVGVGGECRGHAESHGSLDRIK